MAMDEIRRIEEEGIEKTKISDWRSARILFKHALSLDMSPLRRAEILANVALTYLREGNTDLAYSTAEEAMGILNIEGISAPHLRGKLQDIMVNTKGTLTVRGWPIPVVFIGGAYLGFRIASYHASFGSMDFGTLFSHYGVAIATALVWCAAVAAFALRGWNQYSWQLTLRLLRHLVFSFACSFLFFNFFIAWNTH